MTDLTLEQAERKACPLCKGIGASVGVDEIHPDGRVTNPRPAVCMVCDGEGTVDVDAPDANAPTPQRAMILSAYYDQTTALCDLVYGTDGDALDGAAEFHADLNAALADAYEDGKGNLVDLLDTERAARQEAERERDEARREIDASRAHVIALDQQNVALLRWQSVASDAHIDHLCAIVRALAVSDETPRVLRDLSADGVESEIRRVFKAERINREKSEASAAAARKERDNMSGQMLDERTRANEWLSLLHDLRNVVHRGLTRDASSTDIDAVLARVDAALVRS